MSKPTVACVFHHTLSLGCDRGQLVACLNAYVDQVVAPLWASDCTVEESRDDDPAKWRLVFLDDADQAQALGYHRLQLGTPYGYVFLRPTQASGEAASAVASHELAEMLTDPCCNLGALSPRGRWVALEIADPVQDDTFVCEGLPVSNVVTPAWYGGPNPDPTGAHLDYMGTCSQPWEVRPGGYVPFFQDGRWQQLFGSTNVMGRVGKEDRRMRRFARRSQAAWAATGNAA